MATTVKDISEAAFDAVALALDGVVYTAVLSYDKKGEYYPETGKHTLVTVTDTGRAIFGTASAIAKSFPAYTAGSDDLMIMLEGFTAVPRVGWRVTVDSIERTIKAVGDIAGAGEFFEVVAA